MQLNEADIKAKLIISVLILTVGIGVLLQLFKDHKMDDEPTKTYSVSISQGPAASYSGTVSNSSTTTTTL